MIVSGDKDFIQLQQYNNVKQYAPIQKQFVGEDIDPKQFLLEQINLIGQMVYQIYFQMMMYL